GSVGDRDLMRGLLVLLVGHDRPAPERIVIAGLAVYRHAGVDVVGVFLFRRRGKRRLECGEDDLLRHVLLARQGVDQQQKFAIHDPFLQSILGTSRARPIVPNGNARTPAAVSTRTFSPSVPRTIPLMRFAPSTGAASVNCASSPAKRAKSASLTSGRSNPGDDTSSRSKSTFSTAKSRVK